MARFEVRLTIASNRAVITERAITRADTERAILFAQKWLHESRKSTRILWLWYDRWEVWEADKDDTKRCAASGESEDASSHHAGHQPEKRRRVSKPTTGVKRAVVQNQHKRKRTRELTPFQSKMQLMLQSAKDKASNGTVSRMGSNTHD